MRYFFGRCSGVGYHKVLTLSLQGVELTSVTARKVVELKIIYRPMINKISPRLVIIPKTELERLYAEKTSKNQT